MQHVVIIGNGIAGITTARQIRKRSSDKITIISGETDHFFSRTALMYIYMGHMKYEHTKPYEDSFWKKNDLELVRDWVESIEFEGKSLKLKSGSSISYDKLVIATGSKSNRFGWPGQELLGVQGLYAYQDLELMEETTKEIQNAVVVGGGLIGIEMAEMLHSRGIHVTYLVREKNFWDIVLPEGEAKLIERHIREHGIELLLETELKEILGDNNGKVSAIVTNTGSKIDCQFVGLTVGVSPNIDWLGNSKLEIERGILVNEYLETNLPDVYAVGDCAQLKNPSEGRRPIEAVWYVGKMMGETLAQTLTGNRAVYHPGTWYNSAKFFDIEYQTYGIVSANPPSEECHFYWESHDGNSCVNIAYHERDTRVLGVNTFGIRMRHEIWNKWIGEGRKLDYVVSNLKKANFDPEFYHQFDVEIQRTYNEEFPENPIVTRKRSVFEKIFN